jgi:hypothetical protein
MQKLLVLNLLFALMLWGCEEEETDYSGMITGTWVNTQVNYTPILTDSSYVCEFRSNMVELYAIGLQQDENNKSWIENDQYTYRVEGKNIIIEGSDMNHHETHMVFEIISLTDKLMTFSVPEFYMDGVADPDTKIYTCTKVTEDYSHQFTGIWYGRCTTPGTTDTGTHYWEYFDDGSFNYYYQNDLGQWIRKSDNDGGYFLYGNLMVSNYTNDLISGGTGKSFECWNFEINGNRMTWTGLRQNGQTITYEMEKVASVPSIE